MKFQVFILMLLWRIANAMYMPEDTELLEGYSVDLSPEIDPEDTYLEAKSLIGRRLINPIRDKRSPRYIILESQGLRSHFKDAIVEPPVQLHESSKFTEINGNKDYMQNIAYNKLHPPPVNGEAFIPFETTSGGRKIRSLENADDKKDAVESIEDHTEEELPLAAKQIMDSYQPEGRSSQIGDRWTKAPYDVQDEDDSVAEATSVNDGIKARTPRVNFITQQKKSMEPNDSNDDLKSSATKAEIYRNSDKTTVPDDRYYRRPQQQMYEELPQYRKMDDYSRRYERYHYDRPAPADMYYTNNVPQYPYHTDYSRTIDPVYDRYMPRDPAYPEHFYEYPDSRYDLPETRDYRPLYTNEIVQERYPTAPQMPYNRNNNRRIIYYATLPDIVRTPPSVDLRYKSYNRYDDPYYSYYNQDMEINRNRPHNQQASGALKLDRNRNGNGKNKEKLQSTAVGSGNQYNDHPPIKVSNTLTITDPKQQQQQHSRFTSPNPYNSRPIRDYNSHYY